MAKKKVNDDTLLQLIRDGISPAELEKRISALEEMRNRGFYSVLSPQSSVLRNDVSRMFPWKRKRLMMTHSYN